MGNAEGTAGGGDAGGVADAAGGATAGAGGGPAAAASAAAAKRRRSVAVEFSAAQRQARIEHEEFLAAKARRKAERRGGGGRDDDDSGDEGDSGSGSGSASSGRLRRGSETPRGTGAARGRRGSRVYVHTPDKALAPATHDSHAAAAAAATAAAAGADRDAPHNATSGAGAAGAAGARGDDGSGARGAGATARAPAGGLVIQKTAKGKAAKANAARAQLKGQQYFALWTVPTVTKAYLRVQKLGKTMLQRREYCEAFVDYDIVLDTGEFLCLPPETFRIFADDDGEADLVDSREVLIALSLFCKGAPASQLELAFRVFDTNNDGDMDLQEMCVFFASLCRACHKVGALPVLPSDHEIVTSATQAFEHADLDGGGSLDRREFVVWAKGNVLSRNLLSSFTKLRRKQQKNPETGERRTAMSLKALMKADDDDDGGTEVDQELQARIDRSNRANEACRHVIELLQKERKFTLKNVEFRECLRECHGCCTVCCPVLRVPTCRVRL